MRRWFSVPSLFIVLISIATLSGCGGSSTSSSPTTVPGSISVSPTVASLDLGGTTVLTPTAKNFAGNPVTLTFSWKSSNPDIVSVSTNGLVCAGKWDSLVVPIVCTPSGIGSAQITASASGISSPPVTVYVHPHVDHVTITAQPPTPGVPGLVNGCYSTTSTTQVAASQTYQAQAFSNGSDVSALVGPFSWNTAFPQVATVKQLTGPNGVQNGMAEFTAKTPGATEISASISGTNSSVGQTSPLQTFTTCPVQMITLALPSGGTTFTGAKGAGFTVLPTVTDSNGQVITGVPLTWTSTQPKVAAVTTSGGVSNTNPGGASITAACTPPTCNINLATSSVPLQAVYATDPITATWTPSSTTIAAPTLFLSTTGCGLSTPIQNCATAIVPVSGSPPAFGATGSTTNIPNSFAFDPKGTTAYMGTANGLLQLNAASPPSTTVLSSAVKGRILAVAPDGKRVIVADTQDTPNQVFVYDGTVAPAAIRPFLITGATAASFSPDGLKAFIVAHDPAASPPDHLYVYSNQMPLQTIPLGAQAFDVAFAGNGMFGFLAGGSAGGSSYLPVCDNSSPPGVGAVGGAPGTLIRQLPGNNFLTLSPPNVFTVGFTANAAGPIGGPPVGCPQPPLGPPGGLFSPTFNIAAPGNLGQGTFTPLAFDVSPDGQKAYVLAPNVASLIVYDIASRSSTTIPLVGNPVPLAGALSPDGLSYYVTGFVNDANGVPQSSLHQINLTTNVDAAQLAISPQNLCGVNNGNVPACKPDLIAMP